jgi:hypothetical protein
VLLLNILYIKKLNKNQTMKPILYTVAVFILLAVFSCIKIGKNDYYISTTGNVEIVNYHIPDTANNNEVIQISAVAQAYNQCWSNINFQLTKTNDYEYILQALGTYVSYGSCADGLVTGDTVIPFTVTHTGLYKFQVYKGPYDIETDTLIVK